MMTAISIISLCHLKQQHRCYVKISLETVMHNGISKRTQLKWSTHLAAAMHPWLHVRHPSRGQRFDSSHRQNILMNIFTVDCLKRQKLKKKRPQMAPF